MAVYLKDDMVLLDSGLVATSEDCCCDTDTGACCYEGGFCEDLTESDCNDSGGEWQGLGTSCSDDPCPCEEGCNPPVTPPCSCGFAEFIPSDPPIFYLVKTTVFIRNTSATDICNSTQNETTIKRNIIYPDGSCIETTECSGSDFTHIEDEGDCTAEWVLNGAGNGCKQAGFGCPACGPAAESCNDPIPLPISSTVGYGECEFDSGVVHADSNITVTLSEPFNCIDE